MMQPIHAATSATIDIRGNRVAFKWSEECENNRLELATRVMNQPRWFTHFKDLVTEDSCLYILSDSCDTGGGVSLHVCNIPDARDVVPEVHLRDHGMSRLLNVKFKCFSEKKQRLPTFELEYLMAWTGVVEWGNLITTLTMRFPPGENNPCKIGIGTDSTTAAAKLNRLTKSLVYDVPPEPIDYINARAKRMRDMADAIAYSNFWPLTVRHTAGRSNSLCDLISRIAFQLKELAISQHKKAIICPLRIHSYHDNHETGTMHKTSNHDDQVYRGLCLDKDQLEQMKIAYQADNTIYKKVKMSDIYNMCVGNNTSELPPAVSDRIRAWIGKRFIAKDGLMWTPASLMQFRDAAHADEIGAIGEEELEQSKLHASFVTVIPRGAEIQISEPEKEQHDCAHTYIKEQQTLINDIMWIAHEGSMHACATEMALSIRKIAWWSTVMHDCKRHIQMCTLCIQAQKPAHGIGISTGAMRRMSTIQFDHCVLDEVIKENTSIWAVLTIVDVASGCIALAPAKTKTARETAYLLFTQWIKIYGVPLVICSDADAGYVGNVMKHVTAMLGIRNHQASARAQKGTAAHSERANSYVRKAERSMIAAGNASTPEQVHMYMAMGEIMANQQTTREGHTTHERLFGQTPLTVMDLIAPTAFPTEGGGGEGMGELDSKFIKSIADCTRRLIDMRVITADARARDAALEADVTRACGRSTFFDIRPGDTVSYSGNAHELIELNGPENEPITAIIKSNTGKTKKVQYTSLRPLGIPRPALSIPMIGDVPDHRFILADRDDEICAGIAICTLDDFSIKVHIHEANIQMNRWVPLWQPQEGTPIRVKKQPKDHSQYTEIIFRNEIECVGSITVGGVLSMNLQTYLENQGLQ